ncbi:hypothetical protein DVK02_14775 [Halobellus sp. Atlit-31R]|nr:hypothetical protein DVK02_14775 [Halobellus sp. Atlit-31R]
MDDIDAVDSDGRNSERVPAGPTTEVTTHRSSPDRVVFTEAGNSDGWIALDADAAVTPGE